MEAQAQGEQPFSIDVKGEKLQIEEELQTQEKL
jgi:hypothetical protein